MVLIFTNAETVDGGLAGEPPGLTVPGTQNRSNPVIPLAKVHHTSFFSAHNDAEVVKPTHGPRRCGLSNTPLLPHEGNRGSFNYSFFWKIKTQLPWLDLWVLAHHSEEGALMYKFPWGSFRCCPQGQNWSRTSCDLWPCCKIKQPKREASFLDRVSVQGISLREHLRCFLLLCVVNPMMWIFRLLHCAPCTWVGFPWNCVTSWCNFFKLKNSLVKVKPSQDAWNIFFKNWLYIFLFLLFILAKLVIPFFNQKVTFVNFLVSV